MRIDLDFKYKDLLAVLKNRAPFEPDLAVILGSGLGNFADSVDTEATVCSSELPGYPQPTIVGHTGKIHFAKHADRKLLLFQGRIHFYEGYKISECVLPAFIASRLKSKNLLITNAAGGINPYFAPGDLMLATSTNSMQLRRELTNLIGLASNKEKDRFIDYPSHYLNQKIKEAAKAEGIHLKEGVYGYTKGPSYETAAEIRAFAKYGIDAIGMSSVYEATYAVMSGVKTSLLSCITNHATGISDVKLSHSEVVEVGNSVKPLFARLVKRFISLV